MVGIRADEHPPATVVGDHFVEEAAGVVAHRTGLRPALHLERMVLEGQAFHPGPRRHGIDALLAAGTGSGGSPRGTAVAMTVDVCDRASIDALFAGIVERFGRLDLLFDNAGLFPPSKPIDEVTPDEWDAAVRTNQSGMFFVMQQAFRTMKAQRPQGGRIINNGSLAAFAPRPASVAYTATKHGVLGLTRAASLDGRACGIAVGQIDIGNAATGMTAHVEQGALQADGTMRPEVRMDLQHVAAAVVTMARLPNETSMQSLTILPTTMPFMGRG